jgi:hypothetical protein
MTVMHLHGGGGSVMGKEWFDKVIDTCEVLDLRVLQELSVTIFWGVTL